MDPASIDISGFDPFAADPADPVAPYGVVGDTHSTAPMVDFRGHNGTSFGLPYVQLRNIAFDPLEGISLDFLDHRIRIHGRNLRPLYTRLLGHQVTFVQEGDLDVLSESETFVDKITVRRTRDEG